MSKLSLNLANVNRKVVIIILAAVLFIGTVMIIAVFSQNSTLQQATDVIRRETGFDTNATRVLAEKDDWLLITNADSSLGQQPMLYILHKNGNEMELILGPNTEFRVADMTSRGVPVEIQAVAAGLSVERIEQERENPEILWVGFNSTFDPGWQIDAMRVSLLQRRLGTVISEMNSDLSSDRKIIRVNAIVDGSGVTVDPQTYVSIFTFNVQFIAVDGTLATHAVTFSPGPNSISAAALDGQQI
jgi:hypothetical protein